MLPLDIVPKPRADKNVYKLPLVSDCKGSWFPVDMLMLDDDHAWTKLHHVVNELRGKASLLLKQPKIMRKIGNEFVQMINAPRRLKDPVRVYCHLFYTC